MPLYVWYIKKLRATTNIFRQFENWYFNKSKVLVLCLFHLEFKPLWLWESCRANEALTETELRSVGVWSGWMEMRTNPRTPGQKESEGADKWLLLCKPWDQLIFHSSSTWNVWTDLISLDVASLCLSAFTQHALLSLSLRWIALMEASGQCWGGGVGDCLCSSKKKCSFFLFSSYLDTRPVHFIFNKNRRKCSWCFFSLSKMWPSIFVEQI